ncbi:MAG: hypothetical protein ACKVIN_12525 [Longimicrobiales bacterium]
MFGTRGRLVGAGLAQVMGQALTAWSIVLSFFTGESISVWLIAPLLAAFVVPFRHNGSMHDRAVSNFGAAIAVGGVFWWEFLFGLLNGLKGTGDLAVMPLVMTMLTAAVLFSLAGGLFWTHPGSD